MDVWSYVCVFAICACVCVQGDCAGAGSTAPSANPVTRSQSGVFVGSWMETRRGRRFQAYRGIPYAENPVKELRFQPPVLIENYKHEVNATHEGPACPQPTYGDYYKKEECLRLNVYTPGKKGDKKYPVVVFMHAGGFYSLSGRSDVAGPHYLLDQDLVLVTINYRLASLGFLSTGDALVPGNNGFKDQVAALKWVQRNIEAFGGDPNLVTLSGYSAGSFSVMLHMVSPMSKGLFHRAISMSGSPISQVRLPRSQPKLATRQARLLNCTTSSTAAMLDCLKGQSATAIGDSLDGMFEFGYDPILIWLPLIEEDYGQERFLTMDPTQAVRQGKMHAVPLMISQTTDEFFWKAFDVLENDTSFNTMKSEWERIAPISFLLPAQNSSEASRRLRQGYLGGKPMGKDAATAKGLGELYSDGVIGFGVHRMANLMCLHSPQPVFYSEFAYIGNYSHYMDPKTNKSVGAAHHDDLLYLFNVSTLNPEGIAADDSFDSLMVDRMTTMWYNFAKNGDPNPVPSGSSTVSWSPMEPARRRYLRVAEPPVMEEHLHEERFRRWEELYPIVY